MGRWMAVVALVACGEPPACDLAEEHDCPSCSDGPVTCTFEDTSVTRNSCGDCQALAGLYQELCDAGDGSSQAEIVDGTVCEPAATL